MTRSRMLLPIAGLLTLAAGCVAPPGPTERGPIASARRLLANEFGARRGRAVAHAAGDAPRWFGGELERAGRAAALNAPAEHELGRAPRVAQAATRHLLPELQRRPRDLDRLLPDQRELAEHLADDLDHFVWLFGPSQRPLNEIDDQRHRTDPDDGRAELSVLARILRRLDL